MGIQVWKKFDVMQLGIVAGVVYAIIGLIIGIVIALFGAVATPFVGLAGAYMVVEGAIAIVAMPIMFGITGFIGGAIAAIIYNFVAEKVGGVKVTV